MANNINKEDLCNLLLTDEENLEEEKEEEEEEEEQFVYRGGIVNQIGGAPKKRARGSDGGDASGFKPVSGYSNKRQRCRLISEEIRTSTTRIDTSDLGPVFDDVVASFKKSLTASETPNKQSILRLFKEVGNSEITEAIGALGNSNNLGFRLGYLCNMLYGDADNVLAELKTLIKTVEGLRLRYMEGVLVNIWGDSTGNISWTDLYTTLSEIPMDRARPNRSRAVSTDDPLPSREGDNDDNDDDDDDDSKPKKYFIGDTSGDIEMPPINELSLDESGGGGGALPRGRGRPKKSG